jgi:outer membrane lipoprotein SlyB
MNTPDEGSPVATGQGGRALGSTTRRGGSSGGSGGPGKSSIVLSLKNGIQGKLDTATGKFTPAEFSPAERARYTQFGGAISEKKTKAKPQNKLLGALKGAVTGAALGGVFGGPLGALIGGVSGGVLGSGILSGQSDPNKPKRSDFPMGRSGAKEYASAMKNHKAKSSSTTGPSPEATKRHAELMNSKDPSSQKRIADYDAKHGEGAYSKELQKKLNKIYPAAAKDPKSGSPVTPTGKVVGRDKLSPRAQKALSRMDAQKAGGLQPDIKTSGPALGRLAMGAFGGSLLGPAGMMGGALLGGGVENIMGNISNAMTQYGGNVKDGNIGTPTAQEQKDFDNLAAKKEKLRVAEAKLGTTNKDIVTPAPPPGGGNNVKVVRAPSPGGGGNNPNDNQTGGSDVDATSPGNGNKAKWSILGIPMPF